MAAAMNPSHKAASLSRPGECPRDSIDT
jgi:hypothetical protein